MPGAGRKEKSGTRHLEVLVFVAQLVVVLPSTLPKLQLPGPTRQPSDGLGAVVKGLRPDPLRGLTTAPPSLPSQVGRGGHPGAE